MLNSVWRFFPVTLLLVLSCSLAGLVFTQEASVAEEPVAEEPAAEEAVSEGQPTEDAATEDAAEAAPYRMPAFMMITTVEWPEDPELQDQLCQFMLAHGFNCAETELKGLEACRRNGIYARLGGDLDELHQAAYDLRDDPAVFCYFISDRRRADSFPWFTEVTEAFKEADPTHPSMIINYACFNEYRTFVEQVDPPLLDYYHYHWDRRRHPERRYLYLDEFRKLAQEQDIPLVRCTDAGVSTEQIRQTVFTSLAYGVKGFHYWVPWIIGWEKDEEGNPVVNDGQLACRVNVPNVVAVAEEVQHVGPALLDKRSLAIYYTAPLHPDWASCQAVPEDFWAQLSGEQMMMGVFEEDDPTAADACRYLLVVNCDVAERDTTLSLNEPFTVIEQLDKTTGEWIDMNPGGEGGQADIDLLLPGGSGELLRMR